MAEQYPTQAEDLQRVKQLIRMRWIALVCILFSAGAFRLTTTFDFSSSLILGGFVAVYNGFAWLGIRGISSHPGSSIRIQIRRLANAQISLDILTLSTAIYLTGGVTSNMLPVFLVYIPTTAFLLNRRDVFFQASLAVISLNAILWLEYLRWIPTLQLIGGLESPLHTDLPYVTKISIFQTCFLLLGTYTSSTLMEKYRQRVAEATRARQQSETLRCLATSMSKNLEIGPLLDTVLNLLEELVQYDAAAMLFINDGKITTAAASKFRAAPSPIDRSLLKPALSGSALSSLDNTCPNQEAIWKNLGAPPMQSTICAPLSTRGEITGLLLVGSRQPDTYPVDATSIVQEFADHAALAVENARLYTETLRKANTDWMTGLYNTRYFYQELVQEIDRDKRYGHHFTLLLCDLDRFKHYNDAYGHLAGDDLLRELADLLRSQVRRVDTITRYGGEEFCILLPETTGDMALEMANRICQQVSERAFTVRGNTQVGHVTISIGVSVFPTDAQKAEELFHAADMALYKAKQVRNSARIYTPGLTIDTAEDRLPSQD